MPANIVDFAGRPIERGARPGGGKVIAPTRAAWYDNIGKDITPALIISYLQSADAGNLTNQMALFDRMVDRDDRLQAVLETRKLAVTGIDRLIQPRIPEDPKSEKAAELCREMLGPLLEDTLSSLLDAVPKGLACSELVWEGSKIVSIDEIPPRLLRWNKDSHLEVDYSGGSGKANWDELEQYKFAVFSYRNKPGAKERRGLLRALSILWVAKHWALRDWAAFVEVFGMPLRLGVYPENSTPDQQQALYDALQDIGADSSAIIQENMRIEFPRTQQAAGAGNPMSELISYADTCYAIRLLGQNLTTESQSGSGTLAGGAHENVRKDYLQADVKAVGAVVEKDIFSPVVGFNLGWDYPTPRMWFDSEDAQDDEARMSVYVEGAKIPGMTYSLSQIRREFAFDEPIDEADTLRIVSGEDEGSEPLTLSARRILAAATNDGLGHGDAGKLSPGISASESVSDDAVRQAADLAMKNVLAFVERMADEVDTPEQLLRRIRLTAPDLDDQLEAAGLDQEELADLVSRAIITSEYNGEAAVDNELEFQEDEGFVEGSESP
jgi:phage gp29-like protein